jgi:hypothetical protein
MFTQLSLDDWDHILFGSQYSPPPAAIIRKCFWNGVCAIVGPEAKLSMHSAYRPCDSLLF